jgi:hypothetical protein
VLRDMGTDQPTLHPKISVLTTSGAAEEIDDEHNDEYEYDGAESDVHPGVFLPFGRQC